MISAASTERALIRLCDAVIALAVLVFMAPITLALLLGIWLETGRSPLQRRVCSTGQGVSFTLWTLGASADIRSAGMTANLVRRARMGSIPQLLSVVFGQMSLLGCPVTTVCSERSQYLRRHGDELKPGLIGESQLSELLDLCVADARDVLNALRDHPSVSQYIGLLVEVTEGMVGPAKASTNR